MWKRTILVGAGAAAVLVISAGCSNSDSAAEQQAGQSSLATETASATAAPSSQDHNNADVWFARHMIPHHQQAIEMSDIMLAKQGIDPRVADLATKIEAAQGPEIKQMQDWLTQWGIQPMPSMPPGDGMPGHENMPGHGDMPGGDMPGMSGGMMGMLSAEQMTALKNAQDVEASRLFLTGMIAHHEGAIAMAQNEIEDGQFPSELELSRSIVTSQQQEIDTMRASWRRCSVVAVRILLQRVSSASVSVDGETVGAIQPDGQGLVALVGVTNTDDVDKAQRLAEKVWQLRILDNEKSAADVNAPILVVSQFTLYANTAKGRRPTWNAAAPGAVAEPLVTAFADALRRLGAHVETGVFGAHMQVQLVNDGPVTVQLEL